MSPFDPREWRLARERRLTLGPRGHLMGILNVTPDSFSDGGRHSSTDQAVEAALEMVEQGAAIIDIGGESTKPGVEPIDAEEELGRVLPVLTKLVAMSDVLLSIDTYRSETASAAICAGAHIVNDVTGLLGDVGMAPLVAKTGAGLVAMHNSRPEIRPDRRTDPIEDQRKFVGQMRARAIDAGVDPAQIVFDPGIGFGKDAAENLQIMSRLNELTAGPLPLLLGTSRKRFIGAVTRRDPAYRDVGTAATTVLGRDRGAAIFRVHDVAKNWDALRMTDAILEAG